MNVGCNSKLLGVAILIYIKTQFSPTNIIADKNKIYLIVSGTLLQLKASLVNIYAQNFDNVWFVNALFSLPLSNTHKLILGEDFNCVLNPSLNRSSCVRGLQLAMFKAFSDFMLNYSMVEPWRFRNPSNKKLFFPPSALFFLLIIL